jgi:hypothetical protein
MEVAIWDWDCYAMCRNNYRIYHDPIADKIVFMPHGMDQIFHNPQGSILPEMKGLVARAVLETHEGRRQYFERMAIVATNPFTDDQAKRTPQFGYGPELRFRHYSFRNSIAQSGEPASSGGLDDVQDGPVTSSVAG